MFFREKHSSISASTTDAAGVEFLGLVIRAGQEFDAEERRRKDVLLQRGCEHVIKWNGYFCAEDQLQRDFYAPDPGTVRLWGNFPIHRGLPLKPGQLIGVIHYNFSQVDRIYRVVSFRRNPWNLSTGEDGTATLERVPDLEGR